MANILYKGKSELEGPFFWVSPPIPSPGTELWTPSDIVTELWIEGSFVELIGSGVRNAIDLSGNNRNALQLSAGSRPTQSTLNGLDCINFNGSTQFLEVEKSDLTVAQPLSVYFVCKSNKTTSGAADRSYVFDQFLSPPDGSRVLFALAGNNTGKNSIYTTEWGASTFDFDVQPHVFGLNYGGSSSISRDGVSNTVSASNVPMEGLTIGGNYTRNADWFQGLLAEFIVATNLTSFDKIKLEGYLAHKWGLDGNLPAAHIFKSSPPLV